MVKKINNNNYIHRHKSDVERIQKICILKGYNIDLQTCADIWENYSESYSAGWLRLSLIDNDIWEIIQKEIDMK